MPEFAITAVLSFLVIMDPVGLAPLFISIAGDRDRAQRRRIATRAVLTAGIIILTFGALGAPLLEYLGVTIDALRIAGGILLFKLAFDMILAHRVRTTADEVDEAHTRTDVTVFPLAIPLLAGPGAFATILVLLAQAAGRPAYVAIVYAGVVAVLVVAWVMLRIADRVTDRLGHTGINVITRVLGIILAALAVQLVADGVVGIWRGSTA